MPRHPAYERDYHEPTYIPGPDEGLIHFGAQTGWSPEREGQRERDCSVCGGLLVMDPENPGGGPVPREEYDPARHVLVIPEDDPLNGKNGLCCGCMRWAKDAMLAARIEKEYRDRGSNQPIPAG